MWPCVEQDSKVYDLPSRLLKERIVLVTGEITQDLAASVIAQLLFLESEDDEKEISMYIDSPGGDIRAGLGIYDVMNLIKPDVKTICLGLAASMGAFLLSSGTRGKRYALPNSEVMIHQPLGGVKLSQATDVMIVADNLNKAKKKLTEILAKNTGNTYQTVYDNCERDNYLTAAEAKNFGLIDEVIESVPKAWKQENK